MDEETRKRIEAECKAQAVEEDLTFRLNVADAVCTSILQIFSTLSVLQMITITIL